MDHHTEGFDDNSLPRMHENDGIDHDTRSMNDDQLAQCSADGPENSSPITKGLRKEQQERSRGPTRSPVPQPAKTLTRPPSNGIDMRIEMFTQPPQRHRPSTVPQPPGMFAPNSMHHNFESSKQQSNNIHNTRHDVLSAQTQASTSERHLEDNREKRAVQANDHPQNVPEPQLEPIREDDTQTADEIDVHMSHGRTPSGNSEVPPRTESDIGVENTTAQDNHRMDLEPNVGANVQSHVDTAMIEVADDQMQDEDEEVVPQHTVEDVRAKEEAVHANSQANAIFIDSDDFSARNQVAGAEQADDDDVRAADTELTGNQTTQSARDSDVGEPTGVDNVDETCVAASVGSKHIFLPSSLQQSSARPCSEPTQVTPQRRPQSALLTLPGERPSKIQKASQKSQLSGRQQIQEFLREHDFSDDDMAQIWMSKFNKAQQTLRTERATVKNIQHRIYELENDNDRLQQDLDLSTQHRQEADEANGTLRREIESYSEKYRKIKAFAKKIRSEMKDLGSGLTNMENDLGTYKVDLKNAKTTTAAYAQTASDLRSTTQQIEADNNKRQLEIVKAHADVNQYGQNIGSLQKDLKAKIDELLKEQTQNRQLRRYLLEVRSSQITADKVTKTNAESLINWVEKIDRSLHQLKTSSASAAIESEVGECVRIVKAWDMKNIASPEDFSRLETSVRNLQAVLNTRSTNLESSMKNVAAQQNRCETVAKSLQNPVNELLTLTQAMGPELAQMDDLRIRNVELQAKVKSGEAVLQQVSGQLDKNTDMIRDALTSRTERDTQDHQRQSEHESQMALRYQSAKSNLANTNTKLDAAQQKISGLEKELLSKTADLDKEKGVNHDKQSALRDERVREINTYWEQNLRQQKASAEKEIRSLKSNFKDLEQRLNAQVEEGRRQSKLLTQTGADLDKFKNSSTELQKDKEQVLEQLSQARIDVKKLEDSQEQVTIERDTGLADLATARTDLKELQASVAQLTKDKGQAQAFAIETCAKIKTAQEAYQQLQKDKDGAETRVSEAQSSIQCLEEKLAKLAAVGTDLQTARDELRRLAPFENACSETAAEAKDLKTKLATAKEESARLQTQLEASIATADLVPGLKQSLAETERSANDLKGRLDRAESGAKIIADLRRQIENLENRATASTEELQKLRPLRTQLETAQKSSERNAQDLQELRKRLVAAQETNDAKSELSIQLRAKDEQIADLQGQLNNATETESSLAAVIEESQHKDSQIAQLREEMVKLKVESQQREQAQLEIPESVLEPLPMPESDVLRMTESRSVVAESVGGNQEQTQQSNARRDFEQARPIRKAADRSSNAKSQRPVLPPLEIGDSQAMTQNTDVIPDSQGNRMAAIQPLDAVSDSSLSDLPELPSWDEVDAVNIDPPTRFAVPMKLANKSRLSPNPVAKSTQPDVRNARPSSSSSNVDLFQKHENELGTQRTQPGPRTLPAEYRRNEFVSLRELDTMPPRSGQGSQHTSMSPLRLRNSVVHGASDQSSEARTPLKDITARNLPNSAAKRTADDVHPAAPSIQGEGTLKKRKCEVGKMAVRVTKRSAGALTRGELGYGDRERTPTPSQRGSSIIGTSAPAPSSTQRNSKPTRKGTMAAGYAKQFSD